MSRQQSMPSGKYEMADLSEFTVTFHDYTKPKEVHKLTAGQLLDMMADKNKYPKSMWNWPPHDIIASNRIVIHAAKPDFEFEITDSYIVEFDG